MLAVRCKAVESQTVQQIFDDRPSEQSDRKKSGKPYRRGADTGGGARRQQDYEDTEPHRHLFSIRWELRPRTRPLLDCRLVIYRTVWLLHLCLMAAGGLKAQLPVALSSSHDAKLYVAPMEWNLDQFVSDEIRRQGLPVELVSAEDQADFVMTSLYQKLGSHFNAPGNYIQVRVTAAEDGSTVWTNEVNDFAVFFGRLRRHGPRKAAEAIVRKLRHRLREIGNLTAPSGRVPVT